MADKADAGRKATTRKTITKVNEEAGIASQQERLRRMNEDWKRLQDIRKARSADPDYKPIPGGDTGLIIRNPKGEYVIDRELLDELGKLETLAAKEFSSGHGPADSEVLKIVIEHVYSTDSAAGASPGSDEDQERSGTI